MVNSSDREGTYIKFSDRASLRNLVLEKKMRVMRVRVYSYDHKFFRAVAGDARVGEGVRRSERR